MNILLVEPRTPETFWSLRHALRFVGKRAANPPLGLLTMAGLLPRDWSCRLVDRNTSDLPDTDPPKLTKPNRLKPPPAPPPNDDSLKSLVALL